MLTLNRAICFAVSAFLLIAAPSVHAAAGDDIAKGKPLYVDFKNIVVPVIKKNGRSGVVSISVMAEVKDEKSQSAVMDNMPRLRDAFIRTLYGNLENHRFMREDGTLNIESIKTNLMKSARYVMRQQEGVAINDLLFQNIGQQTF